MRAQLTDPDARIRFKRNRLGRWHCYWSTPAGDFEFYAKGRASCSYGENLWYLGEVKKSETLQQW